MIYSVSDLLMYMMIMVYCVTFLLCGVFVFLLKTVLLLSENSGPGKSGRNLRMVVLLDRSVSGTLMYMSSLHTLA